MAKKRKPAGSIKFNNGSYIVPSGGARLFSGWSAYDSTGTYMGFSESKEEAQFMAENSYIADTIIASVCELCLWTVWNDAVAAGERVYVTDHNIQFIEIYRDLIMTVEKRRRGEWNVEIVDKRKFLDDQRYPTPLRFASGKAYHDILLVKICNKPFKLE